MAEPLAAFLERLAEGGRAVPFELAQRHRREHAIGWDNYAMPQDSALVLNNNQRSFWGF